MSITTNRENSTKCNLQNSLFKSSKKSTNTQAMPAFGAGGPAANSCRLCSASLADSGSSSVDLLGESAQCCNAVNIIVKHYDIGIRSTDTHSTRICASCWRITSEFHELYERVQLSEQKLVTHIEPGDIDVKTEVVDTQCAILTEDDVDPHLESEDSRGGDYDDARSTDDTHSSSVGGSVAIIKPDEDRLSTKNFPTLSGIEHDTDANLDCSVEQQHNMTENTSENNGSDETEAADRRIRAHFAMSCDGCEQVNFQSLADMNMHSVREHGTDAWLSCCDQKFFATDLALAHIDRQHKAAHQCDRCDATFAKVVQLRCHRRSEHAPPKTSRKATIASSAATRQTVKLKTNNDESQDLPPTKTPGHSCDHCSATFDQSVQLRRHRRLEHRGLIADIKKASATTKSNREPQRCDTCGKSFVNKYVLATHISRVHDNAFALMCHVCAKTFKSKTVFDQHHRDEHSAGLATPKLQCNICGNWLKNEHSLRNHMGRHFAAQQKCQLCGKLVPNQNALGNHMRYAHNDRVYTCTICDKTFKKEIALKEHLASHTGVDLYSCMYCSQMFKSSANMYAHRKKRHPEQWKLDRNRR